MQETGRSQQENEEEDSVEIEDKSDSVAYAELMSSNCMGETQQDNFTVLTISEAFNIRNSVNIQEENLNGHIVKLKIKSDKMVDSGSPNFFLNEKMAKRLLAPRYSNSSHRRIPPKFLPVITEFLFFQKYT